MHPLSPCLAWFYNFLHHTVTVGEALGLTKLQGSSHAFSVLSVSSPLQVEWVFLFPLWNDETFNQLDKPLLEKADHYASV